MGLGHSISKNSSEECAVRRWLLGKGLCNEARVELGSLEICWVTNARSGFHPAVLKT